jgi:anti-anti-sigma factor
VSTHDAVVWYLRVEQERRGPVMVVTLAGRVSNRTCPALGDALAAAVNSPASGVVLDVSAIDYISSAGLRMVEHASARLTGIGRRFVVCGARGSVNVAFTLAGLAVTVTMEPSRERAELRAAGVA